MYPNLSCYSEKSEINQAWHPAKVFFLIRKWTVVWPLNQKIIIYHFLSFFCLFSVNWLDIYCNYTLAFKIFWLKGYTHYKNKHKHLLVTNIVNLGRLCHKPYSGWWSNKLVMHCVSCENQLCGSSHFGMCLQSHILALQSQPLKCCNAKWPQIWFYCARCYFCLLSVSTCHI